MVISMNDAQWASQFEDANTKRKIRELEEENRKLMLDVLKKQEYEKGYQYGFKTGYLKAKEEIEKAKLDEERDDIAKILSDNFTPEEYDPSDFEWCACQLQSAGYHKVR